MSQYFDTLQNSKTWLTFARGKIKGSWNIPRRSAEHKEPESGLKNTFYISTRNSNLRTHLLLSLWCPCLSGLLGGLVLRGKTAWPEWLASHSHSFFFIITCCLLLVAVIFWSRLCCLRGISLPLVPPVQLLFGYCFCCDREPVLLTAGCGRPDVDRMDRQSCTLTTWLRHLVAVMVATSCCLATT